MYNALPGTVIHFGANVDRLRVVTACAAVVPLPAGCVTTQCEPAGCSSFQHTADGSFCYAAGDVSSLSASFLDPSSGVVGSPSDGITLSWGSPLSTCGLDGIFRQTRLRLICGSMGQLGLGIGIDPKISCNFHWKM